MVTYVETSPWSRSSMDEHTLGGLIASGQLADNTDPTRPTWIVLPPQHREPNPLEGYVVSFARLNKQWFNAPTS